jgi:hypothetical protein
MQNHKKQDKIAVDTITPENTVREHPQKGTGNAATDPFCVYDHKRHAVGSKIVNDDGPDSVCSADGSWKNVQK